MRRQKVKRVGERMRRADEYQPRNREYFTFNKQLRSLLPSPGDILPDQ